MRVFGSLTVSEEAEIYISMASGTNHSSLDRHILQNDDKNDKTQNVYLSRPTWNWIFIYLTDSYIILAK